MNHQQPQGEQRCPIVRVRDLDRWMVNERSEQFFSPVFGLREDTELKFFALFHPPQLMDGRTVMEPFAQLYEGEFDSQKDLAAVLWLYSKRVGELGAYWDPKTAIEWKYARLEMSDVLDFYTADDGELLVPEWSCFKMAVDAYLDSPKLRFHPKRVRQFILEHGMDELENME